MSIPFTVGGLPIAAGAIPQDSTVSYSVVTTNNSHVLSSVTAAHQDKSKTDALSSGQHPKQDNASHQQQQTSRLEAEFAKDKPTNKIWINLVDSRTGDVVLMLPPEAVRLLEQRAHGSGQVMDVRT